MPSSSSRGIFLSYRREDVAYARLLQLQLRERIPGAGVFTDLDSIEPGLDFAEVIREAVESCAVLVALIGYQWATVADSEGHRRLDNPHDFVRMEIQTAFELGVPVIPVLVGGARIPRQEELPSELRKLARLQAPVLSDSSYVADVHSLVGAIQGLLGEEPDASQAAATDVGRTAAAGPNTPAHGARWLRGTRARGGRSVFISYRRKLSEMLARSVNNDLIEHRYDTFMDLENLDSGEFERVILSQIEARQHFVVLLEPGSLDQIGMDGDWLRREIAHALAHGRNVVPVAHKGFEFRRDLVLPPDVAKLPSFNGVAIPPGYFDDAMKKLRTRFLKMPSNL